MKILFIATFTLSGFFIGIFYAAYTLPQGSGLAGPAIVIGNGVIGGIIALILSLFFVKKIKPKLLKIITIILVVLNLIPIGWIIYRLQSDQPRERPVQPNTSPVESNLISLKTTVPIINNKDIMGMGMAKPDFFNKKVLYFYSSPNFEKTEQEHFVSDSLVFSHADHHQIEISYAPPWFYPEHLKMDYEILFMKVITISRDWIEVEVNKETGLTNWISRYDAEISLWPEFLLSVFSVENLDEENNLLRIKPLSHASPISQKNYSILAPVMIKGSWIKVTLFDDDLNLKGGAWMQWHKDEKLLINYFLLS